MRVSRRRFLTVGALGLASAAVAATELGWARKYVVDAAPRESASSPDRAPSDVAWRWFELLYDVVKAEATSPPAASRIYGISAVALYESVVAGRKGNRSLVGQLNGLGSVPEPRHEALHWEAVANTALAQTIRGLYPIVSPASLAAVDSLEQAFADQFHDEVGDRKYERSISHGRAVSEAILDWARTDGFSTYNNCPYVATVVPGAWAPTPPAFNPNPLQPCWGQIRTMALPAGDACPPPDHPAFSPDPWISVS
jgi:hypothetical protein